MEPSGQCVVDLTPDCTWRPQTIGDAFRAYEVASTSSPVIVASIQEHPEIVMFGNLSALDMHTFLIGPGGLVAKADPSNPGHIRVSRFQAGKENQLSVVPATVKDLLIAIGDVGGGYGDAVAMLRTAKEKGVLRDQFAIDPLPQPLRTYYRDAAEQENPGPAGASSELSVDSELTAQGGT